MIQPRDERKEALSVGGLLWLFILDCFTLTSTVLNAGLVVMKCPYVAASPLHQELRRQKHKLNYITKGGGCSRIMDFMIDGVYVICLCIVTTLLTSLQHWSPYNHEAIEAHSQTTDPETDWFRPAQRCRQRKWKSCIIDLWNSNTGMSPSYMQPEENYRKHKQALWRGQTS